MIEECVRCSDEADEHLGGLCRACYERKNGPSDDVVFDFSGTDAMYEVNMRDAGRGYLLR